MVYNLMHITSIQLILQHIFYLHAIDYSKYDIDCPNSVQYKQDFMQCLYDYHCFIYIFSSLATINAFKTKRKEAALEGKAFQKIQKCILPRKYCFLDRMCFTLFLTETLYFNNPMKTSFSESVNHLVSWRPKSSNHVLLASFLER